jgi:hypothetical protein
MKTSACSIAAICLAALAWSHGQAESQPAGPPPPTLEVGVGFMRTPGWLGDNHEVNHGNVWANAEYTTRSWGRFQYNGGSLTTDPSANWDPWVKGIASVGLMVGYHNLTLMGEGRNSRIPGNVQGLDAGIQVVASIFGAPLFVQARKGFAQDQGTMMVVGSYLPVNPAKELTIAFIPTARRLDQKQSRLLFDSPASMGSQQPFVAGPGWQDLALEIVVDWAFEKQWHWVSSGCERWLRGDAARTPLTTETRGPGFATGVSYHF